MNDSLIKEFLKLGASQKNAIIAAQIYMELCEIKRYWDVEYKYDDTLQQIYLTAKKKKKDINSSCFIPLPATDNFSFAKLQQFVQVAKQANLESVFVILVSADMTSVYYEIADGLVEPTTSTAKHLRENKQAKLDSDLTRNRESLEHAALTNTPITIVSDKNKTQPK